MTGEASLERVRAAAAALRAKFAACGNEEVELLVTLGAHGSIHFAPGGAETRVGSFRLATPDGKPVRWRASALHARRPVLTRRRRALFSAGRHHGRRRLLPRLLRGRAVRRDDGRLEYTRREFTRGGARFSHRYGEGKPVREAMQWASAAGSLSVEVHGAMPSMPTKAKIQERVFLEE